MLPAALPALFRLFRRAARSRPRETNRPRNETPVVDLIYTPAGVPAFIIYASTDRELLNRRVKRKNSTRPSQARARANLSACIFITATITTFVGAFFLSFFLSLPFGRTDSAAPSYYAAITLIFRIAKIIRYATLALTRTDYLARINFEFNGGLTEIRLIASKRYGYFHAAIIISG